MIGQQNESKLMMQNKVVFVSRQRESTFLNRRENLEQTNFVTAASVIKVKHYEDGRRDKQS